MENVFNTIGGDNNVPVKDAEIDRAVKAAEVMLQSLQTRASELTGTKTLEILHIKLQFFKKFEKY